MWNIKPAFIFVAIACGAAGWPLVALLMSSRSALNVDLLDGSVARTSGLEPGTSGRWQFRVRNKAMDTMRITTVSKSCSCVDVTIDHPQLATGEEALITARSQVPRHGEVTGWFYVSAVTDHGEKLMQFEFAGRVHEPVGLDAAPSRIQLVRAQQPGAVRVDVVIHPPADCRVAVDDIADRVEVTPEVVRIERQGEWRSGSEGGDVFGWLELDLGGLRAVDDAITVKLRGWDWANAAIPVHTR